MLGARGAAGQRDHHAAVRAITEEGQPLLDLKPGDVTLKSDGRAREIKSFTLVDLRPDTAAARLEATVPPPFVTNEVGAPHGRDLCILVDEDSITPGKEVGVKEASDAPTRPR